MDVHAYILPVDLLFCKLLFWASLHLCSLPADHPLHLCICSAACHKVKRHLSPLHHLINFVGLNPNEIETISPVRRSPGYKPMFKTVILLSKEAALPLAKLTNSTIPMCIYSDRSGFKGGIRAATLLYINDHLGRSLQVYLGTIQEHTVYEAEGVGLIMGLYLLNGLSRQLIHPTVLGTDSQTVIKALKNQHSHSGHYLRNVIHHSTKHLHTKQDSLINSGKCHQTVAEGNQWKGKTKGVIDLQLHWVPGHCDFEPNEWADEEAKLATQGSSGNARFLPQMLCKKPLLSISTLHEENKEKLKKRWQCHWKFSERENMLRTIDNSTPSKKYLCLISGLDHHQASCYERLRLM